MDAIFVCSALPDKNTVGQTELKNFVVRYMYIDEKC